MRCEQCGRDIRNAEMWQLASGRDAPSSRTMHVLCRQCRQSSVPFTPVRAAGNVVAQAEEVVRQYRSDANG